MLIGVDASRALRPRVTGTERYAREIIRHLLEAPRADRHRWRLYTDGPAPDWAGAHRGAVDVRSLPAGRMWTHRILAREVLAHPPDVLFVPAHVIPFAWPPGRLPPAVVTVHDIGYRHHPGAHGLAQRLYLDFSTRWSTRVARRVIAVSWSTARDLEHFYRTSPAKIAVIHEGATDFSAWDPSRVGSVPAYGFSTPYALYVGTLQPRKNLARLVTAYARLVERHRVPWDLVLAGGRGWGDENIERLARRLGVGCRVHFPGYVPQAELPGLMASALLFAFPSLYEGFGLPVLEAQQVGVPVMCANSSALPEVAGDAAILVDPLDVDAIADAMLRLSEDEALRQRLIAAGYENVKRFSWEKAARQTLAVLEEAAESRK